MKAQSAQEGLIIVGLALLLLFAVNLLVSGWRINLANIDSHISNSEECMKLSNEIYSVYILGDGSNSTINMLKESTIENTSIWIGDTSCQTCCNISNGTTNIFNLGTGTLSIENIKNNIKITGTPGAITTNTTIFFDGFEAWGSGDCSGSWTLCSEGNGELKRNSDAQNGSYSIRFRDHDSDTNFLIECMDLSQYSQAWISFWWKKSGLDSGEYGKLEINTTSSDFIEVFDSGTGSSEYANRNIEITDYSSSNTCIKYHVLADSNNDYFYLDDVEVIGS